MRDRSSLLWVVIITQFSGPERGGSCPSSSSSCRGWTAGKGDLLRVLLPVYPLDGMDLEVGAHCFAERREEAPLAEPRKEPETLQLVLDRILHLGEAQLDACRVQGVVELADDVGGGHVDAGNRLGRYHQPAHRCRRARYRVQDPIVEQFGVGEEQRCIPTEQHEPRNQAGM